MEGEGERLKEILKKVASVVVLPKKWLDYDSEGLVAEVLMNLRLHHQCLSEIAWEELMRLWKQRMKS